jgi:glycosyltransferase involved in cell wall biosynthesis
MRANTQLPRREAPLVLHVLSRDMMRGAQVFAKALRQKLDGDAVRHRTLTLFTGPPRALHPDYVLARRMGLSRRLGLDPRAAFALWRLLDDLRPDVLVAHGGEPLKYCACSKPAACTLVYHKIGTSSPGLVRGPRMALHRRLMRSADIVVGVSDSTAREARDLFHCDPDRVVVIPNGRDPARFTPADHDSDGRDGVRLAFVGHMTPAKRPLEFVELVRRVTGLHGGVAAVMVGDGPLLADVRRAAVGLPIEVLGPRDDVAAILTGSDVFVFPGAAAGEGMPGVLIEAGFSALPAVTTAVPGADTVVDDGGTGFLVPLGDLDRLVARTLDLVTDPSLRGRMGNAARQRCLARFTLDVVADAWSDLLSASLRPAAR